MINELSSKKRVLFISYNGMTDPLGQSQVLPYLMQLAKQGYAIDVLSCEKTDRYEKESALIRKQIDAAGMGWYPLPFHDSLPLVSKLYDRLLLKRAAHRLQQEKKYDLIHCRSYVSAEVGLSLKKGFGVPFIFDMRGFWADEKRDSGHWTTDKWVYRYLYNRYKKLETTLLREAAKVVVLTHAAKVEISRWPVGPAVSHKITVIPCCADLSHFSDDKIDTELRARLINELGIEHAAPVLCYLGSIGDAYAIEEMLYFFERVKQKHPAAKFLFFTKDKKELITRRFPQFPSLKTEDIEVRFVPRKELPTYLSLCTFSVFFYVPTYSRIACSPTKFAEISGLGIPVICNRVGDLNEAFLNGLPHVVIADLQYPSIEESVEKVRSFTSADKQLIRQFAEDRYNLMDGVEKYKDIYTSLIGR